MSRKLLNLCLTALFSVVSTAAWALSEVNGVYQIGSAADWEEFAALVNAEDGNRFANAVLTEDITLINDVTMVGTSSIEYEGIFDGAGHTINIKLFPQSSDYSLFRWIGRKGIVKNLKVTGEISTAFSHACAIAVETRGIIRGCYVDVKIKSSLSGDGTYGGIAFRSSTGTIVEDCLVKLLIDGTQVNSCGGVVGWCNGKTSIVNCLSITDGSNNQTANCYNIARNPGNMKAVNLDNYLADSYAGRPDGGSYNNYAVSEWANNPSTTQVTMEDLADGRICYQLNNDQSKINWVQNIGTDPYPVPAAFGSGQVYASGPTDCDGKAEGDLTFSNSGTVQATAHTLDAMGICTTCGYFDFHAFDYCYEFDSDRYVKLSSKEDIDRCEVWNKAIGGFKLNMKMVNDIEYIAEPGHYIFDPDNWVDGDFNGDGHTLTIEMSDMGNSASFIPQHYLGTFENVIMHGSISGTGQYFGSISGYGRQLAVRNVYSDINITNTNTGDNTSGGFFGMAYEKKDVENCIYAGDLNGGPYIGGFSGWAHALTTFRNCAVLGNIIGTSFGSDNSQNICRNPGNVQTENCYVVNPFESTVDDTQKYIAYENAEGIANGELAYFLNGRENGVERFYQRIGTDAEPMPFPREGGLIYAQAASYRCDGMPIGATYSNTPPSGGDPILPDHEYDDGFCVNCGKLQEGFMSPVDGWFEISTPGEFLWWSQYASTHLDASAKLMEDIDLEAYTEVDEKTGEEYTKYFAQVGSEFRPFYGNFDGQRHTISNLHVFLPGLRGGGLISVMNSQPESGFGGLSDETARAAEGVYVKDVVLDETCSIYGGGYQGIVGMAAPWAGHITITGCMNLGDVHVHGGTNGSGIFGCAMSSACHVTINACGMIGDIHVTNDTRTENGSFSGWLGNWAEVTNCFALGTVDLIDAHRGFARHPAGRHGNGVTIKNCYALDGIGIKQNNNDDDSGKEDVSYVKMEDLVTGSVTWKANGYQFRDPVWYQTIGEDEYPFPFDTHDVVVFAAEEYYSLSGDEDVPSVASEVAAYIEEQTGEVIATQSVLDELDAAIEALHEVTTVADFAAALDAAYAAQDSVAANAAVYQAYIDECERVKSYLESHDDFAGDLRTSLESYLSENDEPDEVNTLGTYGYIKENHTATADEIKAETERVTQWLSDAIAEDYVAGTDVSNLIPNSDFTQGKTSWTGAFSTGYGDVPNTQTGTGTVRGVEAWNVTGDQYQTVEDMKPGYYLVGINGAFRPSNNRYSYNYAAGIYANGIFNYFPTVIEDYVEVNDTIDGVNCNLHVKSAYDLAIYDDFFSTDGEDGILGYAVHGETGMACAANVGRYPVYTIAKVGEDGKLTIGIKNPGTKYSNDWTGWGPLKVVYCGDDEEKIDAALDQVIENMTARAQVILDPDKYIFDEENAAVAPNFPEALKADLADAIAAAEAAATIEEKEAAVSKFSELFQAIYDGKQAYIALFNATKTIGTMSSGNLPLVEKDAESGEWTETGETLYSDEEVLALDNLWEELYNVYYLGSYSTEEALSAAAMENPVTAGIVPVQDEDGYYLISTPKEFAAYRNIASEINSSAKGKLTADVDMSGIAMLPIGHNRSGENAVHIFRGTLDGQNHALTNVYINEQYTESGEPATLFYEVKGSVKNLKLTGEYFNTRGEKFMGGLTRWTSENATIDNCEIAVVMHSFIEGDGTHGGVVGYAGNSTISNCLVNVTMIGEMENPTTNCAGVNGWATDNGPTINNTLIISQYENIVKGDNSNVIGRNKYTANNVFYAERSNPGFDTGGTLASDEQLASGEIAWKLNGSTGENAHWFQTLGIDANPHLFGDDVVYYYGGQYVNDKPNPQLNAFAYNLEANLGGDKVVVTFDLNAEAESAEVRFSNGYTQAVEEELTAGTYSVTVPASELGADPTAVNFEVAVTGKGSLDVIRMGESFKVWGPYGMAINNNPESKNFGQVLIAESYPQEISTTYISHNKPGAIYAFTPDFKQVNAADGTPGFYGGLPIQGEDPLSIVGTSYKFDLKDLRFTKDGRLFVARASGLTNSSVYEINPDDLNEPWKPFFTGGELDEATGITYVGDEEQNRMALSLAFDGAGEDLKMFVLGGQRSAGGYFATDYNCSVYNIGTATEWTTAPSANFEPLDGVYTKSPVDVGIFEDGQGGIWFIQRRSDVSAEIPAIKHFDAEGNEDYSDITKTEVGGRIAVTTNGNLLAIPTANGTIVLYETNYVPMENGKIWLEPKNTINVGESRITALAFDYADNLYVASASTETFSRYTIPTDNKVVVTPGNGIKLGITGDVNNDGTIDIADVVEVLSVMAGGTAPGNADVNNDGAIDIADVVEVLYIMSQQ